MDLDGGVLPPRVRKFIVMDSPNPIACAVVAAILISGPPTLSRRALLSGVCKFMRSSFLILLMLSVSGPGLSDCSAAEQTSVLLSSYLHQCGLPLVEARVIAGLAGNRTLLLYGFVATQFSKLDAESHALDFMDDPDVEISNLIKVTPELLSLSSSIDGAALVFSEASTADQSANDTSTAQLESLGAENALELPDAITDHEARQPLESFDNDE